MNKSLLRIPISQLIFTVFFLAFFFTVLNGYLLNLVSGYQANTGLVLAGLVIELAGVALVVRGRIAVAFEPLELAGFCVVVVGVWGYFVFAALPTLLPPTPSMDAVRHYLQALFSYPQGTLVSWYPAGGAFVAAMVSHWTGLPLLRVLHPAAASFVALSAGAMYGMACALLPRRRMSKVIALIAPALLFVPWSYFAGIIMGEQYFYAQAFAQFFVIAAWWYIASYADTASGLYLFAVGGALIGVVTAYPYLTALPLMLFVIVLLARGLSVLRSSPSSLFHSQGLRVAVLALFIFVLLMVLMAVALQQGGILELGSVKPATEGDVGEGGVANPTLETLGGPLFLLLAAAGIPLARRAGSQGRCLLAFLLAWLLQLVALLLLQPLFRISGYRLDKTFYILVFPLALAGAMALERLHRYAEERLGTRSTVGAMSTADQTPGLFTEGKGSEPSLSHKRGGRASLPFSPVAALVAMIVVLSAAILVLRPPVSFQPLSEGELQTAQWAKEHLNTYQVNYLEPESIRAYWLAFGLWRETLPNEWFQWIPPGTKMGPKTYDEWLHDDAWAPYLLVRDVSQIPAPLPQVLYRYGKAAILQKPAVQKTPPKPQNPLPLYYGSTVKLLGYDLPRTKVSPGDTITITTYVESIRPPTESVYWRLELMGHDRVVAQARAEPFDSKYPLQRWPPGRFDIITWSLPLSSNITPGIYDLELGLFHTADGEFTDVHPLEDEWSGLQPHYSAAPVSRIRIPPAVPSTDEMEKATPLQARFGGAFLLSNYALEYKSDQRVIQLALYWQSLDQTQSDYTMFVHVLDAGGQVVAQKDSQPLDGRYPTSAWEMQDVVKEQYEFSIPTNVQGPFSIEIGMYAFPSLERLPVNGSDHILLSNIIP